MTSPTEVDKLLTAIFTPRPPSSASEWRDKVIAQGQLQGDAVTWHVPDALINEAIGIMRRLEKQLREATQ